MPSAFSSVRPDDPPRSARWWAAFVIILCRFGGQYREWIMELNPGGIIAWLLVGIIAGWLAGQFMRGGGFGLIGDLIMGIIGAFIGGLLFSFLLPGSSVGLLGSVVVAFVGAVVLILLIRALPGRSPI
jgi:uncharacterized membrane protein YeaQ/YmgE (transglycosylase-associated protein family)